MTRRGKTCLAVTVVLIAVAIGALLWGRAYFNSVDRKVERILDVVRRHSLGQAQEPGIVERTLIKLGLEKAPPQLEGSLGGSITRIVEDRSMKEDEVSKALIALGPPAVPRLIEALDDEGPFVPEYAAYALGRIGGPGAVAGLLAALDMRRVDILERRSNTELIVALGRIGDPRATEKLILLLQRDDTLDDVFAAQALGEIGTAREIEALIESLGKGIRRPGGHSYVLTEPGRQLYRIGQPAVEPLIRVLQERGEGFPLFQAAVILNKIGGERAKAAVQAALATESDGFRAYVEAATKAQAYPLIILYPDGEIPFVSHPDESATAPADGAK